MPSPMSRYVLTNMEQERRAEEIRAHLPFAAYLLLVLAVGVLSMSLVSARHKIAALEAQCQSR